MKRGKHSVDTLHFTVLDARNVEVTGVVWAQAAALFHKVLDTGKVYKFSNVVPINSCTQNLKSRLNSPIELRFTGVHEPQLIDQNPFPNIDHNLFVDMESLNLHETGHIVGLLVYVNEENNMIALSNGPGRCFAVNLSAEKFVEFKALDLVPFDSVLGIFGARKVRHIENHMSVGPCSPVAVFEVFDDTVLIPHPNCEASDNLEIWNNQLMVHDVHEKQY